MCESFNVQYNTDFRAVMPTNLYGPNDNYDDLNSHVLAALIKKILKAKQKNKNRIVVWGNGNPKREFLHVEDLASAIEFLLNKEWSFELLNIGSGEEISIEDLSILIKKITNFNGEIEFDVSKPDGNPRKLLDSEKINSLGWNSKISLEEGIESTYSWYINNLS